MEADQISLLLKADLEDANVHVEKNDGHFHITIVSKQFSGLRAVARQQLVYRVLGEYIGKQLGGYLLSEAIKISFNIGSKRIWVHTCSLDHENALKNYLSRGMKVFKSEILNL